MSRKMRYNAREENSAYHKGFLDGMKSSFEERELDAYYAGVGYGKKLAGEKHLGFNSDEERQQFEDGMKNNKKHFRAYRAEKPTLFERIFGGSKERAIGEFKQARNRSVSKQVRKRRKTSRRQNKKVKR